MGEDEIMAAMYQRLCEDERTKAFNAENWFQAGMVMAKTLSTIDSIATSMAKVKAEHPSAKNFTELYEAVNGLKDDQK